MFRLCVMSMLAAVLSCGAVVQADSSGATERPNVILIMADDMGFCDLGCYGGEIRTPHLDALAKDGLRFTQFYNTARCCPTRASLLTGLYSHQAGMGCMVGDYGLPAYQGSLNKQCVTIAEVLKQGGYQVFMSGKWHVGEEHPSWPVDRGFDRYFGLISGACNFFRLAPGRMMAMDNEPWKPEGDDFYMTDAITDYAIKFLKASAKKRDPFFLYVAYTAPHFPLHARAEDIEAYKGVYDCGWDVLRQRRYRRLVELGLIDPGCALSPRDSDVPAWKDVEDKAQQSLKMAVYAAQITSMDQGIGRIMHQLDAMGLEGNTIVMFLSDNGGASAEIDAGKPGAPAGHPDSYMTVGRGWANASNTPFRLFKRYVHEGGILTPLVVRWPNVIKGGRISGQVGHVIDLMATCADVAGVQYPQTYGGERITPLEGESLLPVLQGRPVQGDRTLFWEHEGHQAVRRGKWKLVSQEHGRWELYDLEVDRSELHDLSKERPALVQSLMKEYKGWAKRCGVVPFHTLPGKSNVIPWYRLPLEERTKLMNW